MQGPWPAFQCRVCDAGGVLPPSLVLLAGTLYAAKVTASANQKQKDTFQLDWVELGKGMALLVVGPAARTGWTFTAACQRGVLYTFRGLWHPAACTFLGGLCCVGFLA